MRPVGDAIGPFMVSPQISILICFYVSLTLEKTPEAELLAGYNNTGYILRCFMSSKTKFKPLQNNVLYPQVHLPPGHYFRGALGWGWRRSPCFPGPLCLKEPLSPISRDTPQRGHLPAFWLQMTCPSEAHKEFSLVSIILRKKDGVDVMAPAVIGIHYCLT